MLEPRAAAHELRPSTVQPVDCRVQVHARDVLPNALRHCFLPIRTESPTKRYSVWQEYRDGAVPDINISSQLELSQDKKLTVGLVYRLSPSNPSCKSSPVFSPGLNSRRLSCMLSAGELRLFELPPKSLPYKLLERGCKSRRSKDCLCKLGPSG